VVFPREPVAQMGLFSAIYAGAPHTHMHATDTRIGPVVVAHVQFSVEIFYPSLNQHVFIGRAAYAVAHFYSPLLLS